MTYLERMQRKLRWYALLAKSGGLGDFAIGFADGNPNRPVATIGYYSDGAAINCRDGDLDENLLPIETPERRALLESRIAECVENMDNGGYGLKSEPDPAKTADP